MATVRNAAGDQLEPLSASVATLHVAPPSEDGARDEVSGLLPVPAPETRSQPDSASVRAYRRLALRLLRRGDGGTLLLDEDGRLTRLGKGEPEVNVSVRDPRAYEVILRQGSIGLGSSYVAGWWDADDVTSVLRLLWRRLSPALSVVDRIASLTTPLDGLRRLRAPDRDDDKRNIHAHYDLSNDFFELMLDPTMTYSCAVFESPATSLQAAQEAKLERICTKLELSPNDHLVEIGTGWGGLATYAAGRYGCTVTTTTISRQQHEFAERRIAEAGLSDRVRVVAKDWRDLRGEYDKLVSVEMIEAVDWRHHAAFLERCSRLLRPGGLGMIQAITIADRSFDRAKRHQDFIRSMIFPSSCIPSVAALTSALARATDLRVVDLDDIGPHYAETLRRWRANLAANHVAVKALGLRPGFERLWHLYLCYCEAAFEEGHISDVQMVLAKPGRRAGLRPRPA
jgi:cyclopropane-fatty-acyl-phospholipid synthase